MLSKPQIRTITSLQHKKFRREHGLFVVEGMKSVMEFVHSDYHVKHIFYTSQAATKLIKIPQNIKSEEVSEDDLKRISTLKTPQGVLALVHLPTHPTLTDEMLRGTFHLILDDIQDPGNLGTIIRTADWFGFHRIICSAGSVDAYNPKVVQASMGSLARMQVYYTDVTALTRKAPVPVFGAMLNGTPIYETDFGHEGLIVLGNEGNGISASVLSHIQQAVTIPRIGNAESLNVAISAALFCTEIARGKK
ncbi:TrmH family RNA methyltransferase [Parapedobacter indicus]|uniref:RNA methyltransferase, TrmH family n=1 Tax=Parapedobacter indicus TaxID=1477437 RepID=A0A1I3UAJ9_9SPHI|nr:RNA methyltransferase [Parapedobacter indicus]PPK99217.1 TrmH family RNA methyltransferase [Parapedobacter indicus]SFJ79935.1 RNA methyltransferase, TrmH family [Parapedobacter indicus]